MKELELIKFRCGIAAGITAYDADILAYIEDCKEDMIASGVPKEIVNSGSHNGSLTAITLYVKAHLGMDREDTEQYLDLYRRKVFRLTLEGEG